jgi:hypothetical protein
MTGIFFHCKPFFIEQVSSSNNADEFYWGERGAQPAMTETIIIVPHLTLNNTHLLQSANKQSTS